MIGTCAIYLISQSLIMSQSTKFVHKTQIKLPKPSSGMTKYTSTKRNVVAKPQSNMSESKFNLTTKLEELSLLELNKTNKAYKNQHLTS